MWNDIKKIKPEAGEEVLILIEGHRSPSWSNDYPLVAYLSPQGDFRQERHPDAEPISVGEVLYWREIDKPKR